MAGPSSADVPDRYDVVFSLNDGTTYGFLFADSVESNLPFRTHKALYSYSPTFLERQNVSNTYGDNFQDFFLTGAQADFSEGEGQHFFRVNDQDSIRKYWGGKNIEPTEIPGNVTLTRLMTSQTLTSSTTCSAIFYGGSYFYADTTNLYKIDATFTTLTTVGAHGVSSPSSTISLATDNDFLYLSSGGSGNLVRKYNGSAFSSFSTSANGNCGQMVSLNNILYGLSSVGLVSFDTSGTATVQFQWKDNDGTVVNPNASSFMVAYGGSLAIALFINGQGWSLWEYDGAGCRKLADLAPNFTVQGLCVSDGIIFLIGTTYSLSANALRNNVYYYSNGSAGLLYKSKDTVANTGANQWVIPWNNGVVFPDVASGNIMAYDLATGGAHSIAHASWTDTFVVATDPINSRFAFFTKTTGNMYSGSSYNSSGYLQTSQYDFDNTLQKVFRGVKVDVDLPANTSVDLAYQIDGAGGSYTSLRTGAASGTEYSLPANTTGSSISVQVTLNATSPQTSSPTLKRVYVRAAPTLQQFRKREYLFDLASGTRDEVGKTGRRSRDGTVYPVDAITACNNLAKIATQTIPFTVYDRFTTSGMNVLADLQENQAGYDGFAIYEVRPNVFIGRINLREV